MFTGLVEASAKVLKVSKKEDGISLMISKPESFDDLQRGHSICVNGACLTVVNDDFNESNSMTFDLGAETLKITNHADLKENDSVNVERALKMGDRLHGHIVTGHVDELSEVEEVKELEGGCLNIRVKVKKYPELIWSKGSIVLNGVSLTINDVTDSSLEVCLIPETIEKTNLKQLKTGDRINIEYDFMAKGVIRAGQVGMAGLKEGR
jgi:riboflavin synthase